MSSSPNVAELYAKRATELKKIMAEKYAAKAVWAKANPEKAAKLEMFFSGKAPEVNWAAIEQKAGVATRAASATVLSALATQVENMIVASADFPIPTRQTDSSRKHMPSRKVTSAVHSSRPVLPS